MSIIDPKIEVLLDRAENDRFLLCSMASKRAHDINEMIRLQRQRAIQSQSPLEIGDVNSLKPLSLAFKEIASGDISYNPDTIILDKVK